MLYVNRMKVRSNPYTYPEDYKRQVRGNTCAMICRDITDKKRECSLARRRVPYK